MSTIDTMTAAYIEAIFSTETGDTDQPSSNAELTALTKAQAHAACRNFLAAAGACVGFAPVDGLADLDPAQLGHDLWLTRNGHGVGFWDRPGIYGQANAELFTRLAKAMGAHDADFIEDADVPDRHDDALQGAGHD